MYRISPTKSFKKSLAKLKNSGIKKSLLEEITYTINTLAAGKILPIEYKDHQLTGDLAAYRDCHITSDMILIYKIEKKELILLLIDIGSHSNLFG